MSATNGGVSPTHLPPDDDRGTSDTESGSSYVGSAAPDTPACPYQTSEYFGHECSRYYDCPTHMIERDVAEDGAADHQDAGTSNDSSTQVNGIEGNEEGAGAANLDGSVPEAAPVMDAEASQSQADANRSSPRQTSSTSSQAVPQAEQSSTEPGQVLTLMEALERLSTGNEPLSRPGPHNRPVFPGGTASSPAQPTSSMNPAAPSFSPRPERRAPPEITLPRWQPDSEVTYCPICRTQFSFFVRKHHCRKCGRVVCSQCSPHKITIPHQYIVRPPGERPFYRYSFLGDEGSIADFSTIGGGEQVRLCNPCVPDPNTTPPQTQHSTSQFSPRSTHQRSQSSSSSIFNPDGNQARYLPFLTTSSPGDPYSRSRSVTVNSGAGPSRPPNNAYTSMQNRILAGTPPAYYPQPYSGYRHPSLLPPRFPGSPLVELAGPSSSSSAAVINRPLPPPPQIPEEDECPICHRELPSRELPNFEARRESHIASCIIAHSTYGPGPASAGGPADHGTPPPRTARRTGMFPYLATEKDCVDSAECTICLEEFEVGVPMARLECLCRFHRSCITAWFVDHPGRCPVHQHDSFGY
ncbi:FYVE-domain-containing protein [Xylariaceae sp. FL0662B]|nr:FYVE-domain-containing protein [Xylariaceae sp. FL0662B]